MKSQTDRIDRKCGTGPPLIFCKAWFLTDVLLVHYSCFCNPVNPRRDMTFLVFSSGHNQIYKVLVIINVWVLRKPRSRNIKASLNVTHVSYTFNRETIDRHIDRRRRALTQLQKQLSTLTSNVHDLKSKKVTNWGVLYSIKKKKQDWVVTYVVIIIIPQLKLSEQLQRRTHLEEQKAELTSKNDAFAREIRVNTKTS